MRSHAWHVWVLLALAAALTGCEQKVVRTGNPFVGNTPVIEGPPSRRVAQQDFLGNMGRDLNKSFQGLGEVLFGWTRELGLFPQPKGRVTDINPSSRQGAPSTRTRGDVP